ncbi:EscG/YscG/SsaH family type III secretion system needle protein co-chaperone [Paraburkholderia sediminicola]|uniref:EscG/YscG/SsaH family type III secretion system needle protein co-chaperone n=1 Tax=Paraburkholderia sediminicola TaxID=458836 RepID=UPI0038B8B7AC
MRQCKKLVFQAAFAAVNHGLVDEIQRFIPVLPFVAASQAEAKLCEAFLLWSLGKRCDALSLLEGCVDADAHMLRRLILGELRGGA